MCANARLDDGDGGVDPKYTFTGGKQQKQEFRSGPRTGSDDSVLPAQACHHGTNPFILMLDLLSWKMCPVLRPLQRLLEQASESLTAKCRASTGTHTVGFQDGK